MELFGWISFVLFLLSSDWLVRPTTGIHTTSQCAQFGQGNMNTVNFQRFDETRRPGPFTIGAKIMDAKLAFLDYATWSGFTWTDPVLKSPCPYPPMPPTATHSGDLCTEFCPPDSDVEIRTYAVEQDGVIMNGWLHFEVELKDPKNKIIAIYVQVRDEYFNAIGDFVHLKKEQCPPVTKGLVAPTEYQVFPCSAVGVREAKVSSALYMVDNNYLLDSNSEKFLPVEPIHRGIHFTWRLHEYWCNRHLRFRPEAVILTENSYKAGRKDAFLQNPSIPKIYRKAPRYWIHHGWYGAADIKLPFTKLSCDKLAINYKEKNAQKAVNLTAAPWLTRTVTESLLENDYISPKQQTPVQIPIAGLNEPLLTLKSCQHNVRIDRPKGSVDTPGVDPLEPESKWPHTLSSFAGRCENHSSKNPGHQVYQGCNLNARSEEFKPVFVKYPNLTTYSNYISTLFQNRTNLCSVKCVIPTLDNIPNIQGFKDSSQEEDFTVIVRARTENRNASKIENIFSGRKYHGVTCIIWSMFLLPVGIFCARYLKETCMQVKCTGVHFWFWVHLLTAMGSVAMFASSLAALAANIYTWGRSEHPNAVMHLVFGYISIGLFLIMLFIGGLRGLHKRNKLIMATLHSVIGFLIYLFNLMAMLYSCFIPASPSMEMCDENGDATKTSKIFYVIVSWMVLDLVIHVAMSMLQYFKDRSVGLQRPWWCPIIPFMPHDSADDMIGSSLRKVMLVAYACAAFIFTNTAIGLILKTPLSEECQGRLGPLSCKELWGCSPSAKIYAAVVKQKKVEGTVFGTYVFELLIL